MRNDGHIDPELFELFLRAGVHTRYAEAHLYPSQIDEVDSAAYVGSLRREVRRRNANLGRSPPSSSARRAGAWPGDPCQRAQ